MNDESMVGTSSTEFSVMTDDHVTSPPANALVRKIEETVSQTEGDRTEKVQQPQTSRCVFSTRYKSKNKIVM